MNTSTVQAARTEAHPEGQATDKGGDWRHAAVCRETDPELFHPIGEGGASLPQEKAAKAVCARCPVVKDCLIWALDGRRKGGVSGIWGGTTERQRRALLRKYPHLSTLGGSK